MRYLGHIVSQQGVAVDPEKTAAVRGWPIPTTVKEVCSFLGFAGYYRRFVSGFSKVAGPLNSLLQGMGNTKKAGITWTPACQAAFEGLKGALLQAPVLAFADFNAPFRLYTDASLQGLGAVLAQVQEGKERVIAYASRSLHPPERNDQNYSSFKLEFLALKWAVTEKFKDYLWGAVFKVYTDNRPLTHLQSATLGATEQWWAAQLANFNFELCYRPGSTNQNADALSRLPTDVHSHVVGVPSPSPRGSGCCAHGGGGARSRLARPARPRPWTDMAVEGGGEITPTTGPTVPYAAWSEATEGVGAPDWDLSTGHPLTPVVVPAGEQHKVWTSCHQAFGHARGQRIVDCLRARVYWEGLVRDSQRWTAECQQCVLGHAGREVRAPLHSVVSHYPFEILALDYLSLGRVNDAYPHILVMTDLFSKYAVAVPTKDQTAQTTVRVLWRNVIQVFGCPERILTESDLMRQLCQVYGCTKSRTTPYHPQGNGACERFNQTLLGLLNTLDQEVDRAVAVLAAGL